MDMVSALRLAMAAIVAAVPTIPATAASRVGAATATDRAGGPIVRGPPARAEAPAPRVPGYDIDAAIAEAAARFRLPADWIRAVIRAESAGVAFDAAGRPLVSRAGAIGLMQLMPGTYAAMARAQGLGPDPGVPRDNILAGTAFLRQMYDRFGSPGFLAAYNAGPGRWADHVATGAPLPRETLAYLANVGGRLGLAGIDATGRRDPAASGVAGGAVAAPSERADALFVGSRSRSPGGAGSLFFTLQGSSGAAPAGAGGPGAETDSPDRVASEESPRR
jgi:hypothetical protein